MEYFASFPMTKRDGVAVGQFDYWLTNFMQFRQSLPRTKFTAWYSLFFNWILCFSPILLAICGYFAKEEIVLDLILIQL